MRARLLSLVMIGAAGCGASQEGTLLESRDPACLSTGSAGAIANQLAGLDRPFLVAIRLTPASYPSTVTGVRYWLAPRIWEHKTTHCDTAISHRVDLFVGAAAFPDATPAVAETLSIAVPPSEAARVEVHRSLTAPLRVEAGQHLFVAVEVAADVAAKRSLCVAYCSGAGRESFSSGDTTAPPHTWQSFLDKGYTADLVIGAELR